MFSRAKRARTAAAVRNDNPPVASSLGSNGNLAVASASGSNGNPAVASSSGSYGNLAVAASSGSNAEGPHLTLEDFAVFFHVVDNRQSFKTSYNIILAFVKWVGMQNGCKKWLTAEENVNEMSAELCDIYEKFWIPDTTRNFLQKKFADFITKKYYPLAHPLVSILLVKVFETNYPELSLERELGSHVSRYTEMAKSNPKWKLPLKLPPCLKVVVRTPNTNQTDQFFRHFKDTRDLLKKKTEFLQTKSELVIQMADIDAKITEVEQQLNVPEPTLSACALMNAVFNEYMEKEGGFKKWKHTMGCLVNFNQGNMTAKEVADFLREGRKS